VHILCVMNGKLQRSSHRRRNEFEPRVLVSRCSHSETKLLPPGEEQGIIQSAIVGNPEALSLLFARETDRLYRAAFSVLHNKQDAEDALQNGLLSAYLNLGSFQGRSKFSTWLTRIVVNAALMNRRKRRALRQMSIDEATTADPQLRALQILDPRPGPDRTYAIAEIAETVENRINELSPSLRSAFRLRHVLHLSNREAANAASVKTSAMKSRAVRARQQLAILLAGQAFDSSRE
jgi:RNA polymerase sigma-70 factor, ECF subfamily